MLKTIDGLGLPTGLSSSCLQAKVKDYPASIGVINGQHFDYLIFVGILGQECRYKSVSIHVPHNAWLAPERITGD